MLFIIRKEIEHINVCKKCKMKILRLHNSKYDTFLSSMTFMMLPEPPNFELFEGSQSFWYEARENNESVVVCFHGFGASPFETKPIANKVVDYGIDAIGPLLPGHGIKNKEIAKKEMSKYGVEDWVSCARETIRNAQQQYEHVYAYGQSMGGAIALLMASEGRVEACAVTGAGIRLPPIVSIFYLLGLFNFNVPHHERNDYYNETYLFRNSRSIRQLKFLSKRAKKGLEKITCPVLACHSHNDPTIHPKVVEWIKNSVQGPVQVRWFDKSGHTIPLDVEKEKASREIARFFMEMGGKERKKHQ